MKNPPEKLTESQISFVKELTAIQGPLRNYCFANMPGHQGIEDVIQESNRVVLEKADEFVAGTNFQAWVFSIARFQVLAHLKRVKRGKKLLFSSELTQLLFEESIETSSSYSNRLDALRICLKMLKKNDARLIKQRYGSSTTLAEFSKESGRTVESLKQSLYRIRNKLRECIGRRLSTENQHG